MIYKVLHISGASLQSGAGKGALNTHNALLKLGMKSKILFLVDQEDESKEIYNYSSNLFKYINRFLITFLERLPVLNYPNRKNQKFSTGLIGLKLANHSLVQEADLIHLHWVNHGFINIKEFKLITKPIVWTLRDMWAFTGGCHYAFNCEGFKNKCGLCPVLGSSKENDLSSKALKFKLKNIDTSNIKWVAISNWLKDQTQNSTLLNKQNIDVVYSGIDTTIFKLRNRDECRAKFSLPLNQKLLLIGAQNINDPYKGVNYIMNAFNELDEDFTIVSFGNFNLSQELINKKIVNVGYISNDILMSELYSACDMFISTSIAEAFGKTIAEAQSCGIPVVCFNIGGPKDIVEHKITGFLAETENIESLKSGIQFSLDFSFDKEYIITRAEKLFSMQNCIIKYIEIYKTLLNH